MPIPFFVSVAPQELGRHVSVKRPYALDWSLPGGQDRYFKAISDLAAGGGLTGEKMMEISKTFDTNFPSAR